MSDAAPAFRRLLVGLLLSLFAASGPAKPPKVAVPEEGKPDPIPFVSAQTLIPRDTLIAMYRRELGELFKDADVDKYYSAHELIEDYFEGNGVTRKAAVKDLEQTKLNIGIVGRLTRLRMRWPALEPGVYYVNEHRGPYEVRYFLGIPKGYDRTIPWPLVVKLGPVAPLAVQPPLDADQVGKLYNAWIKDELAKHADAVVLMPLLNLEELYGPSSAGMNTVMEPLRHAADRVNVDSSRVYLIGHSTGGFAAWNIAMHYPTYFAAIAPLAGGAPQDWQKLRLHNLRNVLPVVWHDAKDTVVKPDYSRSLVTILRNYKQDVDYLETKDAGHPLPDTVAEDRYKVMRARTRQLYPTWVTLESNRPDVQFNRDDWVQIWQEADTGKEYHILLRGGSSRMTFYTQDATVDAKRDGNAISLTLDNVESMRLFVNDQMVDLDKNLTITINKKRTIQGRAKKSIDQMLNDQLLIGRGWRYYTGSLDIDLTDPSAATRPATNPSTRPTTRPAPRTGKIIIGPDAEK